MKRIFETKSSANSPEGFIPWHELTSLETVIQRKDFLWTVKTRVDTIKDAMITISLDHGSCFRPIDIFLSLCHTDPQVKVAIRFTHIILPVKQIL